MKTYRIKNYKGNLVESLSKFQKKYPGMKICEATEEDKELKIKCNKSGETNKSNESCKINEGYGSQIWIVSCKKNGKRIGVVAVCDSEEKAEDLADEWESKNDGTATIDSDAMNDLFPSPF